MLPGVAPPTSAWCARLAAKPSRRLAAKKGERQLAEIASKKLVHAHPDHTLDAVIVKLGQKGVSQLPVVGRKDVTKLLGIITMHDVAAALSREEDDETIDEAMNSESVMASRTDEE